MLNCLQKNVEITHLSNFKTKAFSSYFYDFNDASKIEELSSIFSFAEDNNLKTLVIWWWTNLLFAFDNFEGIVIKISLYGWDFDWKHLFSYSSELISDISEKLEYEYKTNIWHRFIWLPWTIWGAVYWNAWCFWLETENNFISWQFYNIIDKGVSTLTKSDLKFDYRTSILKQEKKLLCLSAVFDLSTIIEKYSSDVDNIYFREHKQPKWNSCWSFFKNPHWDSAWRLIEEVWLKWYRHGTAYFSDLHSNFLMSDTNWNYKDLITLKNIAIDKVKNKFWVEIENEVQIITN